MQKELSAKRKRFCQEYIVDSNGTQAAIRAGYSIKTAQEQASQLLSILMVKEYISQLQAELGEKIDHDRDIAISILHEALALARHKGDNQGRVSACRELNSISNLHNQTITQMTAETPLTQEEQQALADVSRDYKLKLSTGGA